MPTGNAIQTSTIISGAAGSGTSTVTIALLDATGTVNAGNAAAPGAAGSVLTSSDTTDAIWSTTTGSVGYAGTAGTVQYAGTATVASAGTVGSATLCTTASGGTVGSATLSANAGTATISGTATVSNAWAVSGATINTSAMSAPAAAGSALVSQSATSNIYTTTLGTIGFATNLSDGTTLPAFLAPAVSALTMAATILVNAALANDFRLTLTSSTATMGNPSNPVDGQNIKMQFTQDTTGTRTIAAWGTSYDFGVAGTPVLSTATSTIDVIGFVYNSTKTKWLYLGSALGF